MRYVGHLSLSTLVAGSMVATTSAQAQDGSRLDAAWIVNAGGFFMSTDTRVRVDGDISGSTGTDVDFDDTFGLDDRDRFRIDAAWRFSPRHVIRLTYFENNNRGEREMTRDIDFGEETYPLGATVSAESRLRVAQLAYDYAFMRKDTFELAAGIGVHMLDTALSLAADVQVNGNAASRSIEQRASTQAPLPVVGLRGLWRFADRFYLNASAQYFYVEIDPYSGTIADFNASVVWQATSHFGIGFGYDDFRLGVDVDDQGAFEGRLRWSYGGAMAFVSVVF